MNSCVVVWIVITIGSELFAYMSTYTLTFSHSFLPRNMAFSWSAVL